MIAHFIDTRLYQTQWHLQSFCNIQEWRSVRSVYGLNYSNVRILGCTKRLAFAQIVKFCQKFGTSTMMLVQSVRYANLPSPNRPKGAPKSFFKGTLPARPAAFELHVLSDPSRFRVFKNASAHSGHTPWRLITTWAKNTLLVCNILAPWARRARPTANY